jgi:hypothetical protein
VRLHSVKVTPILRGKRRGHPKGKDVECHESLLALNRFCYGGWDQLTGEHSFTSHSTSDLTVRRVSGVAAIIRSYASRRRTLHLRSVATRVPE